jgi:GAF domain-containing protein
MFATITRGFAVLSLVGLAACASITDELSGALEPIGEFRHGYNIVVAVDPQKGPFSREASNDEWVAVVKQAVGDRLGRYEGGAFYHTAVAVQGYVLAQPGIPLVASPKSVLIFNVTFYEDATQTKLNEEPIQLTVFEPASAATILGSGYTRSREEQMQGLADNAARAIERLMRENGDWFGGTREILDDDPTILSGAQLSELAGEQDTGQ